jgi:hypothetical protein
MIVAIRFFLALIFICTSSTLSAKECTESAMCDFYVDAQGNLIHAYNGKATALAGKAINNSPMQDAYVMLRGEKYYLVRENESNDKSFIIVPIDVANGKVLFSRIIYFSLEMQASGQHGYEIWAGDEIELGNTQEMAEFSWNQAWQWQSNLKSSNARISEIKNTIQDGFRLATSTIHNFNGDPIGQRTYAYSTRLGVTPESLVCVESCPEPLSSFSGYLRGGIGKYAIELNVKKKDASISGTYKYQSKSGELYIAGQEQGDEIHINEYSDIALQKLTGKLLGTKGKYTFSGTWKAQPRETQLPFFAAPDSI